jgi:CHASE2 domain-containing sensor protein
MRVKRLKYWWRKGKSAISIAILVSLLIILLKSLGWFQPLELKLFDRLMQARPTIAPDERIIIVGITETDIDKYQQYPFSDALLAQLLEKIKAQSPKVIGLDLFRDIPVPPGNEQIKEIFQSTPNLIGIGSAEGDKDDGYFTTVNFPPILSEKSKRNNFDFSQIQIADVGLFVDDDEIVRRGILYPSDDPQSISFSIPNLGFLVACRYLELSPQISPNKDSLRLGRTVFPSFRSNDGGYVRGIDTGFQIIINWRGPAESFKQVSFSEVIEERVDPTLFKDRIVLIGATAPTLSLDAHNTPYSLGQGETPKPTYGVEIQANLASQIVSAVRDNQPLIQVWSELFENFWIFLWSFPALVCGWIYRNLPTFSLSGVLLGAAFILTFFLVVIAYVTFLKSYWIPLAPCLFSLWMTTLGSIAYIYIARIQQANFLLRQANITLEERVALRTTELSQRNRELEQTLQKLHQIQEKLIVQERLSFLGRYVAGINHEIGGLLNCFSKNQQVTKKLFIQLQNNLAEQKLEQCEEITETLKLYLEDFSDSLKAGKALIKKFTPENLANEDNPHLEFVTVDLASFIQECLALVRTKKRKKQPKQTVQIQENYDLNLKTLKIVPSDFSMVLVNLIDNAWDSLLKKQKQISRNYFPRLFIKTRITLSKYQIIIQDNGVGVDSEEESKIFETFFTTKPQGEGLGLGLSLSRDIIVARYKGDLYYQSIETDRGKETQFIVEIPID